MKKNTRKLIHEQDDIERLRREYSNRKIHLANRDIYTPFNLSNLFFIQSRQRAILSILNREGFQNLTNFNILELGCGNGGVLLELLGYGAAPARLHGCDLLHHRLTNANRLLPHLPIACAEGQDLPYPTDSFDIVLQFTVFSSILDDTIRVNIAREMLRVLAPGGMILWYDFWLNPTNKQTRGIRPPEIRSLFPGCRYHFHRITLAPPIARRLVRFSWSLCSMLEKIKVLNTHYLVSIIPE